MKGLAERTATSPAPYQLNSTIVASSPARRQCGGKTGRLSARMKHHVAIGRRGIGQREAGAERAHDLGARGQDVDHRDIRAGQPRAQARKQQPDHAAADDGYPVAWAGISVQVALSAVSIFAAAPRGSA